MTYTYRDETVLRITRHSQAEVARMAGIAANTINRIVKGTSSPKSETLDRINAAIDILEGK